MTGTEAANGIIDTTAHLDWYRRRTILAAFLNAASDLDKQTLGADAFAVELRATLENAYETLTEQRLQEHTAQAERDERRDVLGEE